MSVSEYYGKRPCTDQLALPEKFVRVDPDLISDALYGLIDAEISHNVEDLSHLREIAYKALKPKYFKFLPDEIVYEILSYLPFKTLIRIQLVSKRFLGISRDIIQRKHHLLDAPVEKLRLFTNFSLLQASEVERLVGGDVRVMNSEVAVVDERLIDLKTGDFVEEADSVAGGFGDVVTVGQDIYFASHEYFCKLDADYAVTSIKEYDSHVYVHVATRDGVIVYQSHSGFRQDEGHYDEDGWDYGVKIWHHDLAAGETYVILPGFYDNREFRLDGYEGSKRVVYGVNETAHTLLVDNPEAIRPFDKKKNAILGDKVIKIESIFHVHPHLKDYEYDPFIKSNCIFFEKENEAVIVNIVNKKLFTLGDLVSDLFIHEEWVCATIQADYNKKINAVYNLKSGIFIDLSTKVKGVIRGFRFGKIITDSMIYDFLES